MTDNVVEFPQRAAALGQEPVALPWEQQDPAAPWEQQDPAAIFAHRAMVAATAADHTTSYGKLHDLFRRAMLGLPVDDSTADGVGFVVS